MPTRRVPPPSPPRGRLVRGIFPVLLAAALLSAGCEKLFPKPERPSTDGYRAKLSGRSGGRPVEAEIAWRTGSGILWTGNPGVRRGVLVRADRREVALLDEATKTAKVRPMQPGETLWNENGSYLLDPVPPAARDAKSEAPRWPGHDVTTRSLSDALVGPHPCDVIRYDRMKADGSGLSEYRYFARDLDGLVVRREVVPVENNAWKPEVEILEMSAIRIGLRDVVLEIPEGWTVERIAAPTADPATTATTAAPAAGPDVMMVR